MNKEKDLSEQLHKTLADVRESAKNEESSKLTGSATSQLKSREELQVLLRPKPIDYESAERYVSSFEELKQKFTPEIIDAMMNGAVDENFWSDENLRKSLEEDIAFPIKVWSGFSELGEITGLKESKDSKDWEQKHAVEELIFLCAVASRTDLPINIEARVAALKKMRDMFSDLGFSDDILKGSAIMKLAYIGEAESMEKFGMDWRETPPFSSSIDLNKENPLVQEALKEEQEKRIERIGASGKDLTEVVNLKDWRNKHKKPPVSSD